MVLSAMKRIFLGGLTGSLFALGGAWAGTTLHMEMGKFNPHMLHKSKKSLALGKDQAALATNYFIIQYKDRISQAQKQQLKNEGARIHRYIPDDALLVSGDAKVLARYGAQNAQLINGVVPYLPGFKLSTDLEPMSVMTAGKNTRVVVQLFKDANKSVIERSLLRLGAEIHDNEANFLLVELKQGFVPELAAMDGVEHIQPYKEIKTMNMVLTDEGTPTIGTPAMQELPRGDYSDVTGYETGTEIMKFSAAWSKGYLGGDERVAIADTGLDMGTLDDLHGDFNGGVFSGYSYGLYANDWSDPMGHGTHVAGSVGGRGVASESRFQGGAPQASIVVQGMWSPMLGNLTVPPQLSKMFSVAYKDGARIHTNSWGSDKDAGAYDGFANQVDQFMWDHPDMLILFAAGNSGVDRDLDGRIDEGSIASPGTAKNTLTVGASENMVSIGGLQAPIGSLPGAKKLWGAGPIAEDRCSDNEMGIAFFSSRGPTRDGRLKPEVVAPGTNVLSVMSRAQGASQMWGPYNDDYVYSGGTSMSTPLVAGGAAVLRQYLRKEHNMESPSAALMKAIFMNTAFDLFPGQFGEIGAANGQELLTHRPDVNQGFGRVDMEKIMNIQSASTLIDEKVGLGEEESFEHSFEVTEASQAVITMVYTDAPAAPSAGKALVNDLDMELVSEDGSSVEVSESRINNHEHIEMELQPGHYTLKVKAHNLPQGRDGKQAFAAVLSLGSL